MRRQEAYHIVRLLSDVKKLLCNVTEPVRVCGPVESFTGITASEHCVCFRCSEQIGLENAYRWGRVGGHPERSTGGNHDYRELSMF